MKKFISIVLAVVMVMAMASTVFGLKPSSCINKNCYSTYIEGPVASYTFYVAEGLNCVLKKCNIYRCGLCGTEMEDIFPISSGDHVPYVRSATCDGTYQTRYNYCNNCDKNLGTTNPRCPGAGQSHSGGCRWLPV